MTESVEVAQARYEAALHAMQSGIAMRLNFDHDFSNAKHLRVGVNSAMVSQSALVGLLLEKGIITEQEYFTALADAAETEKRSYEKELSDHFGSPVTLH